VVVQNKYNVNSQDLIFTHFISAGRCKGHQFLHWTIKMSITVIRWHSSIWKPI